MNAFLTIFFRWLHIVPACLALGGLVIMRFVLPAGLSQIPEEHRAPVLNKCRRIFKMVIHTSILLFLISGAYNSYRNFPVYGEIKPMGHALWGLHIMFGLIVIGIALMILTPKQHSPSHRPWMVVNIVLILIIIALGSSLKYVRDNRAKPIDPVFNKMQLAEKA